MNRHPTLNKDYQCKGTYRLGSACGECFKCIEELGSMPTADLNRAFHAQNQYESLKAKLNTPELKDFSEGVERESEHQIMRWGTSHDEGKTHPDWFWLVGYLAGKVLTAVMHDDTEKALHHTISTAAVLRNWHRHILTGETVMRPGIPHEE